MKSIQEIKQEAAISDLIIERFYDLGDMTFNDLTAVAQGLAADIIDLK